MGMKMRMRMRLRIGRPSRRPAVESMVRGMLKNTGTSLPSQPNCLCCKAFPQGQAWREQGFPCIRLSETGCNFG